MLLNISRLEKQNLTHIKVSEEVFVIVRSRIVRQIAINVTLMQPQLTLCDICNK